MKQITGYIREYFQELDWRLFTGVTLVTVLMIFCNYYVGIDGWISKRFWFPERFAYRYLVQLIAFGVPYLLIYCFKKKRIPLPSLFLALILLAPAIFSLKMALNFNLRLSAIPAWNHYWNRILFWPLRLLLIAGLLALIWKQFFRAQPFFGFTVINFNWKPYAAMLLLMLPLIAIAATQPDFQATYPKLRMISKNLLPGSAQAWYQLLFELSYGTDFIGIELFFRGFLILALAKWVGKDAILPMACFYCSIHFGKPLGECISSYFGGLLLGIIVYHTRSIMGGLIVHLGIAWIMELAGWIALSFSNMI